MAAEDIHPVTGEAPPPALLAKTSLLVFHIDGSTDDQVLFQAACLRAKLPVQWQVAESAARGISYFESLLNLSSVLPSCGRM